MNQPDKDRLYDRIDDCDDMSDEEKREAYFAEIAETEWEEDWQNENHG